MFDNQAEKQYHIHCRPGDVGKYVFLPGDPFRTDLIAQYLDDAKVVAHNREHKTWTGYLNGEMVSVTSTGMGCPSAAIAMEELIKCGADTFIRIGTAGRVSEASYDESIDHVVVNAAIRDEGTSIQYIPIEYPAIADRHIVKALMDASEELGLNALEGVSQSKDSFYGQHEPETMPNHQFLKERWNAWEMANVACSEMESSILFVLGSIRKCRAGSIMSFKDMGKTIEAATLAVKKLIEQDRKETI